MLFIAVVFSIMILLNIQACIYRVCRQCKFVNIKLFVQNLYTRKILGNENKVSLRWNAKIINILFSK